MIITCPHCQTCYQVTYDAIGSAGRKVQCANCQRAWQQGPVSPETVEPDDRLTPEDQEFHLLNEDTLDETLETEAQAVAAESGQRQGGDRAREKKLSQARSDMSRRQTDSASRRKRLASFARRQNARAAGLPLARLRRTLRLLGVVALAGVLTTAYGARTWIVEYFPSMAGVYAAVGLNVNVVGLDFTNVTTLRSLHNGREVLDISAHIVGLSRTPRHVPPVVLTLINARGESIYEWSVTPGVRDLIAGERATFDTQLAMPPGDAASVRLSFAGWRYRPQMDVLSDPVILRQTSEPQNTPSRDTQSEPL